MKRKNSTKSLIVLGLLVFAIISCDQQTKRGSSTRVIEQNTASEISYQTISKQLKDQQSIVNKHEITYNETVKNLTGSIMDKRDSQDAASEIVKESKKLLSLANSALENYQIIQNVSGGKDKILEYKTYAKEKIKKYE